MCSALEHDHLHGPCSHTIEDRRTPDSIPAGIPDLVWRAPSEFSLLSKPSKRTSSVLKTGRGTGGPSQWTRHRWNRLKRRNPVLSPLEFCMDGFEGKLNSFGTRFDEVPDAGRNAGQAYGAQTLL